MRLFLILFFVNKLNSYLLSLDSSCLGFPSIIGLLLNLKLIYIFFGVLSSTCFSVVFAQFMSWWLPYFPMRCSFSCSSGVMSAFFLPLQSTSKAWVEVVLTSLKSLFSSKKGACCQLGVYSISMLLLTLWLSVTSHFSTPLLFSRNLLESFLWITGSSWC